MRIVIPETYSQKRHRTSKNGHRYDPSAKDKKTIREHLLPIKPKEPLESNLEVHITAFFKTPTSWSDKKKAEVEGEYRPKTPDTDNIEKILFDSMNGYIFKDDKQIVRCVTEKRYSVKPATVIRINEISETD